MSGAAGALEPVVLRAPDAGLEATVIPGAGMVVSSLRHRGEELLGQRAGLPGWVERSKTFGIPLLHPWANRLGGEVYGRGGGRVDLTDAPRVRREEHGLPIHGLLGPWSGWQADAVEPVPGGARVVAHLEYSVPELLAGFPFPHRLRLAVALAGERLVVELSVTATGVMPVPLAFGFHPYLQLPGAPRETWKLSLPARHELQADERGIPTGASLPLEATSFVLGEQTFDTGWDDLAPGARFALAGGGRRLEVVFEEGYPAGQLFAPPGAALVCFEPMAAQSDALRSGRGLRVVAPGQTVTARWSVAVRSASA